MGGSDRMVVLDSQLRPHNLLGWHPLSSSLPPALSVFRPRPTGSRHRIHGAQPLPEPRMKVATLLVFAVLCSVLVLALLGLTQPDEKSAMKTATITPPKAPAYSKSGYDLGPYSQAKIDELAK